MSRPKMPYTARVNASQQSGVPLRFFDWHNALIQVEPSLPSCALRVAFRLQRHWNTERNDAFPSRRTLAGYGEPGRCVGRRSVDKGLRALEQVGLIVTVSGKRSGGVSTYRLTLPPDREPASARSGAGVREEMHTGCAQECAGGAHESAQRTCLREQEEMKKQKELDHARLNGKHKPDQSDKTDRQALTAERIEDMLRWAEHPNQNRNGKSDLRDMVKTIRSVWPDGEGVARAGLFNLAYFDDLRARNDANPEGARKRGIRFIRTLAEFAQREANLPPL